jgi:glycosyltransferase involved in cell wall biosynthesis
MYDNKTKIISIIVAAYNEEKTIIQILNLIKKRKKNNFKYQVIVVNDGSTDNTRELLTNNKSLYSKLINQKKNKGKGYAVKEGLKIATGDYVIFQDADLEYDPENINDFCKLYKKYDADLILGSRLRYKNYTRSHNFLNLIGNKLITLLFNVFYNCTYTDIYSGYLSFKRKHLDYNKLKTNGFEQQAEILCQLIKKTRKNYEIPINYNGRNSAEGKKIKFYHIFSVIYQIIISKFKK